MLTPPRPARSLVFCLIASLAGVTAGCESDEVPLAAAQVSPRAIYEGGLIEAGLGASLLVQRWHAAADSALYDDEAAPLPTRQTPAFEAAAPDAWSARLALRRGEVLRLELVPALDADSARVFADLFFVPPADTLPITQTLWSDAAWTYADSTRTLRTDTLRYERRARRDETVVLRVQPELLASGTVAVHLETSPSLGFPVASVNERAIRSLWGAPRDGGARRHEGIDIFAPRGTPVVASASGRITRVQETPLGGRVVWLRTRYGSLYYAHLDSQRVRRGQRVQPGDTLGTIGNTGNARTTPPHLHFGIYTGRGAVDPYPYVVGRRSGPRITLAAAAD
ncbi:MAG: M23 family metallopeptidase [Bacteroidota bacterium]